MPHNVTSCPRRAAVAVALIGCTSGEIKFWKIPGPSPVPFALKIPKLDSTISIGTGFESVCPTRTLKAPRPSRASEGMIALTCPRLPKSGIALTTRSPWVTVALIWPSVSPSGNSETTTGVVGPRFSPKTVKIEPRAILPFGSPARAKLAAFTTARGGMRGWATSGIAAANRSAARRRPLIRPILTCVPLSRDRKGAFG